MKMRTIFAARRGLCAAAALCLLTVWPHPPAAAFQQGGDQTVLPAGTDFAEEAIRRPREIFKSEQHGGLKSYLVNLGDLAFNSPYILGGAARQAGMSCGTCHVNGAGKRPAVRARHVEPPRQLRYHRVAVQPQGRQSTESAPASALRAPARQSSAGAGLPSRSALRARRLVGEVGLEPTKA
jgi:hypothetical protein